MKTRIVLSIISLLAFTHIAIAQIKPDALVISPFEKDFNLIFLPVTINDKELHFIVDTGAGFSILDEFVAKELNLEPNNVRIIERPGGEVRLGSIENISYAIGDYQSQMPIATANLAEGGFNDYLGRSCAGILGYDFISKYALEIDYQNHLIGLYEPEEINLKNGHQLTLEIKEGMPIIEGTINHKNLAANGKWLIDTGSLMGLGVNQAFYEKYLDSKVNAKTSIAVGFGGSTPGKMYKLDSFEFGEFNFRHVISGHAEDGINDELFDGVIGGELLSRFTLIFNYASKELYLIPNDKIWDPQRWDLSGLLLSSTDHGIEVLHVYENSPADQVGIKVGDVIKRINQNNAKQLGLPNLWKIFHYHNLEQIHLEILREDKIIEKNIVLNEYLN